MRGAADAVERDESPAWKFLTPGIHDTENIDDGRICARLLIGGLEAGLNSPAGQTGGRHECRGRLTLLDQDAIASDKTS